MGDGGAAAGAAVPEPALAVIAIGYCTLVAVGEKRVIREEAPSEPQAE